MFTHFERVMSVLKRLDVGLESAMHSHVAILIFFILGVWCKSVHIYKVQYILWVDGTESQKVHAFNIVIISL
jgi:hypothetical protein